jgi:hypothetical protein
VKLLRLRYPEIWLGDVFFKELKINEVYEIGINETSPHFWL